MKNDYVEQETDIEEPTEMEEQYSTSIFLSDSFNEEKPLTFKRLLQHFAAYTQQKKSSMTYLMQLLIRHRPTPLYDMLPSTGKQLMYIDGSDVPSFTFPSSASSTIVVNESVSSLDSQSITLMPSNGSQNETTAQSDLDNDCHPPFTNFRNATWSTVLPTTPSCKRKRVQPKSLPKAISLENGGKYMHFGLEAALAGKSPGQVLQHACLVQHARLYNRSPTFVPASIRKEVSKAPNESVSLAINPPVNVFYENLLVVFTNKISQFFSNFHPCKCYYKLSICLPVTFTSNFYLYFTSLYSR